MSLTALLWAIAIGGILVIAYVLFMVLNISCKTEDFDEREGDE